MTPDFAVRDTSPAASAESVRVDSHPHVLLATCCVVFALSVDPLLWMMGVDIPTRAFGAGWVDYRVFTTTTSVLLVACMLIGGLLGDYFGRRRVLLLASVLTAVGGLLTMVAPDQTWLVIARSMGSAAAAIALPLTLAHHSPVIRRAATACAALLIYNLVISLGLLLSLLAVVIEAVAGWRATLILPTLAIAIGSVLVWRFIPDSRAVAGVLDQATTAVAWSLTLLPLTLGAIFARVNGSWANPITGVALVLSLIGLVALVFVWRGRVRTSMIRGLGQRQRYLLTVMLLTAASLAFGVTGYLVQLYGFFTVVQNYGLVLGGIALVPMLLGAVLTAGWAMRNVAHLEARRLIGGGLAVMALSMAATSLVRTDTSVLVVRATHGPVRVRLSRGANGLDDRIHECHARCRGWRQRRGDEGDHRHWRRTGGRRAQHGGGDCGPGGPDSKADRAALEPRADRGRDGGTECGAVRRRGLQHHAPGRDRPGAAWQPTSIPTRSGLARRCWPVRRCAWAPPRSPGSCSRGRDRNAV